MAWPDAHANFAYSTVLTAPVPATSGESLVVQSGDGAKFPAVPFNATVWPSGAQPTSTTAEIVRVTGISTDTFTMTAGRAAEGTTARSIAVGWQIAAAITVKTLTDIETNYANSWSPYILASAGTGLQTLANSSGQSSSGSLFVFPITIQNQLRFNQVLVPISLSYITSAVGAVNNTYKSMFGLYSMSANTLNLISSNSFSIGETLASASLIWNYPTTTQTAGYGYGGFPAGNLTVIAQIQSYIQSSRVVGLQFGGDMTLSGGQYWMGLMSIRTTGAASSTLGLSHAGVIGQIIHSINSVGSVSGLMPIGHPPAAWAQSATHVSGWFGRHIIGYVTNTSLANFGGTKIPNDIVLNNLTAVVANSTASVLPAITFVST